MKRRRFLHQKAQPGQPVVSAAVEEPRPPYFYPAVPVLFSVFEGLTHILEEGYEGDALADTEALYDGD